MSNIIKLGALDIAKDMIINSPKEEMESSRLWCAGFFAGLHEVSAITTPELDIMTEQLKDI